MRKRLNVWLALISGRAIVIAQSEDESGANVLVGKKVTRRYLINSLASTLKAVAVC